MKAFRQACTGFAILIFTTVYPAGNMIYAQNNVQGKPNEKINVHKKFDEKGNMIYYDSTYSWSSSGDAPEIIFRDTVITGDLGDMQQFFGQDFGFNSPFPGNPFAGMDSMMFFNPFNNDMFIRQFQIQDSIMNELFRQYNSMPADTSAPPLHEEDLRKEAKPAKPTGTDTRKSITL
jgi:hypothetical protein